MIEQLLVGKFLSVAYSAEVFHLNTEHLFDDLISLGLKLHHRRRVCGNVIGSPHLSVNDTV